MKLLDYKTVNEYLTFVKSLMRYYTFIDIHVHPFDVFTNNSRYTSNSKYQGLYSKANSIFSPPKVGSIRSCTPKEDDCIPAADFRIKLLFIRKLYSHTGPRLFRDHMHLSGIGKVLLLPVAPASGEVDGQMAELAEMFGNDRNFFLGCTIPNALKNEDIDLFVRNQINKLNIKAVKLHPNITEINLTTRFGIKRVESILDACKNSDIPLIVHGGRSSILQNPDAAAYAAIDNLEKIDWGISNRTVVISHAGSYSCPLTEIEKDILPRVNKLLSQFSNLMIDISALEPEALVSVFNSVDANRIIFGSDALYEPQWSSVAKVLHALSISELDMEEAFIQIANINPSKFIFERPLRYALAN